MKQYIEKIAARRTQLSTSLMIAAAGGSVASAQVTPAAAGEAAVTGLGLGDMIAAFAAAVRTLVSDNGTALALVILPVLAWYFIRNQLRGSV